MGDIKLDDIMIDDSMIDDTDKLSNPQVTIRTINQYGFHFRKRYGQNFLVDSHVIRKILRAAEITREDIVVEIGPGIGTLTQYLAETAGQVYAVEIDETLIPILADTLSEYENVLFLDQVHYSQLLLVLGTLVFLLTSDISYL